MRQVAYPTDHTAETTGDLLGHGIVEFGGHDYLGLAGHPHVTAARLTETPGTPLALESALAAFLSVPAARTFASGFDANLAAISSLLGPGDAAFVDRFAHRSLHDATRLSGCDTETFAHNDLNDLECRLRELRMSDARRRVMVVVDGVYALDGDLAPLPGLVELKCRYGAFILVDESHALGAVGATGRGSCEAQAVRPAEVDVLTGSLGNALPGVGGFVAGSLPLCGGLPHDVAQSSCSRGLSGPNAAAALAALRVIQDEPHRMDNLRRNTIRLRDGLVPLGLDNSSSQSPVVPVLLSSDKRALAWARRLLRHRVAVSAVTFPAVPHGKGRLLVCSTAAHEREHFTRLFEALTACQAAEADEWSRGESNP